MNAVDRFLSALKGVTDPEHKRRLIGEEFIHIFEEVNKSEFSFRRMMVGVQSTNSTTNIRMPLATSGCGPQQIIQACSSSQLKIVRTPSACSCWSAKFIMQWPKLSTVTI